MALRRKRSAGAEEPRRPSGLARRAALDALAGPGGSFEDGPFLEACTRTFLLAQRAWTEREPDLTRAVMREAIWENHRTQIEAFRSQGRRNVIDDLAVDDLQIVAVTRDGARDSVTVRFFARCADYDVDVTVPEQPIVRGTTTVEVFTEDWVFQRPVGETGEWLLGRIDQVFTYEYGLATLPDPEQ